MYIYRINIIYKQKEENDKIYLIFFILKDFLDTKMYAISFVTI